MTSSCSVDAPQSNTAISNATKVRRAITGKESMVLADIYQPDTNIAIWRRELSPALKMSVSNLLAEHPHFQASMTVTPQSALASLSESFGNANQPELSENIAELVDMFCCLFELERTGLRLTTLDRAMCPKFHVDKVPCRLVTTYQGVATEWLPHHIVKREKLGRGSNGLPDHQSGLYQSEGDIQQLGSGDVALLKGERWEGNENAGLVHRSPMPDVGQNRLLLTLDFMG